MNEIFLKSPNVPMYTKGQLISELLFDVLDFPKNQCKNLLNFCPRILKVVESKRSRHFIIC